MEQVITQRHAKVLIKDYLRATGRKGVTALMKDIQRYMGHEIFVQRTLEKWLKEQDRMLGEDNWQIVSRFIHSDFFRNHVSYANEGTAEQRLKKVGDGLAALYESKKNLDGVVIFPGNTSAIGVVAVKLLDGFWRHPEDLLSSNPRTRCRIKAVQEKSYAKFVYITPNKTIYLSLSGLVLFVRSVDLEGYDYCHEFLLQLWGRKDINSELKLTAKLTHYKQSENQPEFAVSTQVEEYFQENKPVTSKTTFMTLVRKNSKPTDEESLVFDQLIEDVLPHGIT